MNKSQLTKPAKIASKLAGLVSLAFAGKRYMLMKLIAHLILLVFSSAIYASDCAEPTSIESEAVTIKLDSDPASGMYHVRAPQKLNGMELRLLVLSATMKGSEGGKGISLPLAIKTKGELTGSYFHMPTNWLNVRVAANYGEGLCTGLVAKLSM
jgi:hypothetical protein